jgi:hypothetical protein
MTMKTKTYTEDNFTLTITLDDSDYVAFALFEEQAMLVKEVANITKTRMFHSQISFFAIGNILINMKGAVSSWLHFYQAVKLYENIDEYIDAFFADDSSPLLAENNEEIKTNLSSKIIIMDIEKKIVELTERANQLLIE